mmetsp:Transcript_54160/g.128961  ORF Transcript_54160/g.128961 Transcript_54160/m.128961 type:complete len:375 (-) Transcript_54160:130-1254(-)
MAEEWCLIESDPGVFTALCEEVGVKGIQFEEIYTLGPEAFGNVDLEEVHGLVFLFKMKKEADARPSVQAADYGLFFANQVIHNACATQAILSVLMNVNNEKVDIGPHLKEFKEFTSSVDSETAGLAIGNSDVIRKAHNSFRPQSSFEIVKDEKDAKSEDAFHFIGYVCHLGKIFELDGLKKGPILIGDAPGDGTWVHKVTEELQRRIETYSQKVAGESGEASAELRFNLMAIVTNRQMQAEKQIDRERYLRQRANISLVSHGEEVELADEVDDDEAPADIPTFEELSTREIPALRTLVEQCTSKIAELQKVVEAEKRRRDQWAKENARRRHDMVPLALCAMRHLARKKQLMPAFEKGKAATLKRAEEKKAVTAS